MKLFRWLAERVAWEVIRDLGRDVLEGLSRRRRTARLRSVVATR